MFLTPPIGLVRRKAPAAAPAVQLVEMTSVSAGDGPTSLQPAQPSTVAGDLLVIIAAIGSSGASLGAAVANYSTSMVANSNLAGDGASEMRVWAKIAVGGEVGPTVTCGSTGFKVAAVLSFRNHGFANVAEFLAVDIGAIRENNNSSFTTPSTMAGSTVAGNLRLMAWYVNRSGTSQLTGGAAVTPPTGAASQLEEVGNSGGSNPGSGDRGLFIFLGTRNDVPTTQLTVSGFQGPSDKGALGYDATIEA